MQFACQWIMIENKDDLHTKYGGYISTEIDNNSVIDENAFLIVQQYNAQVNRLA